MSGVSKEGIRKKLEKKKVKEKKVEVDLTDLNKGKCTFIGDEDWSRRDIRTAVALINKQYKLWKRKRRG